MRFVEFKETETATKIYAIGDSHAVAVAGTGKFISLATNGRSAMNGANDDAVGKVTPGSTVVLSAGANDMMNPNKQQVVSRISSLISALQQKDCKVFYILFAETDNPKFAQDRNQLRQLVKASLPAGVEVIDMGKLSVASGDGIHAPMGWYASAAAKVKAGAKPGQAPAPSVTSPISTRDLMQQLRRPKKKGVAEGFLNEASSDEAWELVGQPVPEIQQFVKQMGYGNDEQSVAKITPIIDGTPATQIPAASIPKLKNLANKGNDAQTLKAIQQISGRPDAAQQYTRLMQARDAGEGRNRDVSGYLQYVKSGNYDPPVLLKLPTGVYVIGGRTRLYAALALGIPANVKIISANNFQQGVAEAKNLKKHVKIVKGPDAGKSGWIREIKHGLFKGAPKTYYIDLDGGGQANNLPATALRLVKDQGVAEGLK